MLNSEWSANVSFTPSDAAFPKVELSLGRLFPPPTGFRSQEDLPELLSFMVASAHQALQEGRFRFSIFPTTQPFSNQILSFFNVIRYEVMRPSRATLQTDQIFMAILTQTYQEQYQPPHNFFHLDLGGKKTIPPFVFSGAQYSADRTPARTVSDPAARVQANRQARRDSMRRLQEDAASAELKDLDLVGGKYIPKFETVEQMNQLVLEGGRDFLAVPYLPYFSNCNFYGSSLFIFPIIETHPDCSLISENRVHPINKISLGSSAVSDKCEDIVLQCSYTEAIKDLDLSKKYWFTADQGSALFGFLDEPITYKQYLLSLEGKLEKSSESFIPVEVTTFNQPGKIPTSIILDINYYQIDTKKKKLVTASVNFSGFISPSEYSTDVFNYTLKINYKPLTHTELTIAFALPWYVYFVMYLIVGFLSFFMTLLFTLYHMIASRQKKCRIQIWEYLKTYLIAPLKGLFFVLVPVGLYVLIIAIFFSMHLMNFEIADIWCENSDTDCKTNLFWYKLSSEDANLTRKELGARQNKRIGYVFIHAGLWILWRTSILMTLDKSTQGSTSSKEVVSFDKNVWYKGTWSRLHFFSFNLLVIGIELFFVHISFSEIFGKNLWWFISVFKLIGIIIENYAEWQLKNGIMLGPISTTIELMENLVTFGAPDFLEFVDSFILGLGVALAERAYIGPFLDVILDIIKSKVKDWSRALSKIFESDKMEDEEDDDEKLHLPSKPIEEKEKPPKGPEPQDSQASDILLTENSADQDFIDPRDRSIEDIKPEDKQTQSWSIVFGRGLNSTQISKINTIKERMDFITSKIRESNKVELDDDVPFFPKDDFEEEFKKKESFLEGRRQLKKHEIAQSQASNKKNNEEEPVDADENIGNYYNYSVKTKGVLFLVVAADQPIVCLVIWQFYDETAFAAKWSIKKKDFLFYFLFSVIIIVFQVFIDILCYNIMSFYLGNDFLGSLKKWNQGRIP